MQTTLNRRRSAQTFMASAALRSMSALGNVQPALQKMELGEVENFSTLLQRNPQVDRQFRRVWYFGRIPWQRENVTPARLLRDSKMHVAFDGNAR